MKNLIFIILLGLGTHIALSQSPSNFNYQAVIRDTDGNVLSDQLVGIQFRLLQGNVGTSVFQETFSLSTNSFGLVNLKIGTGNNVNGDLSSVDWENGPFFMETAVDVTGGTMYQVLGASELLSVPFALYAESSGSSIAGPKGDPGLDGNSVLSGSISPTTEGRDGDFYINAEANEIYGPKISDSWGTATSLVGIDGKDGQDGAEGTPGKDGVNGTNGVGGKTILSGTTSPTSEGTDGDFYINSSTNEIYGPKASDNWGVATSLVGEGGNNGADGQNGIDGKTVLSGTTSPTSEGTDGDFYINSSTNEIYGPKISGSWGSPISLIGAQGSAGANGSDGKTVLSGTIAPTTEGIDGDFYLNTTSSEVYGPKASGSWGSPTSLIGAQGSGGVNGSDGKTVLSGTIAPTTEGIDGDFYINTTSSEVYGPKASGSWGSPTSLIGAQGSAGVNGSDGKTVLSGTIAPITEGVDGDFYINTTSGEIYGPKASDNWGSPTSLIGAQGSAGANGSDGKTVLNGTIAPTTEGIDGDFYIDKTSNEVYGPKASDSWGNPTSLIGTQGVAGSNGTDGKTVLNGTVAPTSEGVDGDFYINTTSNEVYGPKASDSWGSPTSLIGIQGASGSNGTDGKTILSGTVTPTTEGIDGDFYINTISSEIYGPKTGGSWGGPTSLVGATGAQGPAGPSGAAGGNATYRWAAFHSYSNALAQWSFNNDPDFHGGVEPQSWTDASGLASDMSSDKEVLRTLFQRKGYATKNAMIYNEEWASFSSTNGQVVLVLFRVENSTGSPIDWSPDFLYSCYSAWGERASVALNGVSEMNEAAAGTQVLTLSIPAGRTSTVIFVSTSTQPTGSPGMRLTRLGFRNDSLDLPAGLQFVDDLDTATGGWEQ